MAASESVDERVVCVVSAGACRYKLLKLTLLSTAFHGNISTKWHAN